MRKNSDRYNLMRKYCIEQWTWLASTGNDWKAGYPKLDKALISLDMVLDDFYGHCECFACVASGGRCIKCPVKEWARISATVSTGCGCLGDRKDGTFQSPYSLWEHSTTIEDRKKYAKIVLSIIRKTWEEKK